MLRWLPASAASRSADRDVLLAYFGLACLFSWMLWLPLVLQAWDLTDQHFSPYFHLAGGLGPLLAAVIMTSVHGARQGLRNLGSQMMAWRVGWGWLVLVLLGPTLLYLLASLLVRLIAGEWVAYTEYGRNPEYPHLPLGVLWLANLVCFGYGEEVGWRGFALPRLQRHYTALRASIILAGFWAFWHLPLFAFASGLSSLGMLGLPGWFLSLVLGSVLLSFLANSTGGSILIVAVFHATLDIAITTSANGDLLQNLMGAMLTIAGFVVINRFGPRLDWRASRTLQPKRTGNIHRRIQESISRE